MRTQLILLLFVKTAVGVAADLAEFPPAAWGAETNGLRAGISIGQFPNATWSVVYLSNACTHPYRLFQPRPEAMLAVEIIDSKGKAARPRPIATRWGQEPRETSRTRRRDPVGPYPETKLISFDPGQRLLLERGVRYKMKVQVRLLNDVPGEKYLQPVVLPPLEVEFTYKPE